MMMVIIIMIIIMKNCLLLSDTWEIRNTSVNFLIISIYNIPDWFPPERCPHARTTDSLEAEPMASRYIYTSIYSQSILYVCMQMSVFLVYIYLGDSHSAYKYLKSLWCNEVPLCLKLGNNLSVGSLYSVGSLCCSLWNCMFYWWPGVIVRALRLLLDH